jgi:hypothetical protein
VSFVGLDLTTSGRLLEATVATARRSSLPSATAQTVRDENLDVNTQYKKTYEGADLIRPNKQKTHTMATRSTKAPRVVIRRTKEILPNQ